MAVGAVRQQEGQGRGVLRQQESKGIGSAVGHGNAKAVGELGKGKR